MYYCDELEINAIRKVLEKKKLFRYQGKNIDTECSLFEKRLSIHLNTDKSLILSSGTNALVTALFCLDIKEGDEVLIPAYTFFATAAAVIELKAVPIVVNIDKYLSFDRNDLQEKLTKKTKALIAVHMDGQACDINFLLNFCESNELNLIEDCAQAIGGKYQEKKLGSFGSFGCFSFNEDKIISCGEGGALTTNDEFYQKAFLYHDTCSQFGPTNKDMYTIDKFSGKSMRVSEIQGAIMNVQLDRLNTILEELKIRKKILDDHLVNIGLELILSYDSSGECATTSRVLCNDNESCNKLILKINKLGIKTNSPMLRPAHQVWQWYSLLPSQPTQVKFDFLPSIDILSRVLLIHVSLEKSLNEWKSDVEKICANY